MPVPQDSEERRGGMRDANRDIAIKKIAEMPAEQVLKPLIFMAGMEAQQAAEGTGRCQDTWDR